MSTTYDQSLKEFDKTVEEMKKHDGFKNTRAWMFDRFYTASFSKGASAEELDEYVEMLNIHTQLLKNLILLENALTNPDNNPELLSVVIESKDPKVKKMAAEFVPTLLEMKIEVERVLANSHASIKNRTSALTFLANATHDLTDLVNDKFQNPEKVKKVFDHANFVKAGPVAKFLKKNPVFTTFVGLILFATAISLTLIGALALPVGVLPGVPMIAAGAALFAISKAIFKAGSLSFKDEDYKPTESYHLAIIGDHLNKIAKDKKTVNGFIQAEKTLNEASSIELQPLRVGMRT
jgi:hypothetical protein